MKAIGSIVNIYRSAGFVIWMMHMNPRFEYLREKLHCFNFLGLMKYNIKGRTCYRN